MNRLSLIFGLVGGLIITLGTALGRLSGFTDFNLELLLGGMFTGNVGTATWILGFALHLLVSGLAGMFYGLIFQATGRSGLIIGAIVGMTHWMISGLLMGIIPQLGTVLPSPGFYGLSYGGLAFFELFVLHLIYGATVGELFHRAQMQAIIPLYAESLSATSNMADAEGQNQRRFEAYKNRRVS